jgi:hypothetical protein
MQNEYISSLFRHRSKWRFVIGSIAAVCDCKNSKTINSRYSLVVTQPTTNLPAHGLSTAERTGSPVFHVLWSIAKDVLQKANMIDFEYR